MSKYYQLSTHTELQWDELNAELTGQGHVCEHIPDRPVDCVDDQLHSPTRGTYLLTDAEAEVLKNDPRIKFINIDYKRYPDQFKPPPDELQSVRPELVNRYSAAVKNYREFEISNTPASSPDGSDVNRTGYQLYRCTQKLDPWVDQSLADNAVVTTDIPQYGTGKHIDVIVADDGTWIGHPEFQNNSTSLAGVPVLRPAGYTGGNLLPGDGSCDLLDLVLDAPYYIDPEWFDANPNTRLITRWDGTRVPVESVARAWWSNSSQRSSKFSTAGTVTISSSYTRANCNGSNTSLSGEGDHGTCCAALTYGRTQGWSYNSNKWVLDLYGNFGSGIEQGFDLVKIFHQTKPINLEFGAKNPTIMSNSWGYRANKDPSGSTYYYTHRASSNVSYTTETGINWLSHMGTQGDAGRWKSEMKTNSLTTALDELITSGVIFVAASGNSNQKQVNSDHPDYNNYITTTNGGSLDNSTFTEFGVSVFGTTNRRGFPQQAGKFTDENGNVVYPAINIGALDDDYKTSKEAKVSYSDRGNSIDVYAPADGTLAANRGYSPSWSRPDTYSGFSYNSGTATDAAFSGTSAACPVAAGFIATVIEHNRDWTWREIKAWLLSLDTQSTDDFYFGTESTTVDTANWLDYESLEGGDARVLYQGPFDARFKIGARKIISNLNVKSGLGIRINRY
jgi:Subtilase family